MSRKPYPTDLTDEQWERLEPLLPPPKSGTPKGGHPVVVDRREVVNAIFYHLRTGGAWRMLPHDFPAWQTVYGLFRDWRWAGVWEKVHAALGAEVRLEAGVPPTPQTLRVDSQTIKTTHRGGPKGYDGGKKVNGRKRFLGVDSLGLVWVLLVTTANVQDRDGGRWLLGNARRRLPRMREVIADRGFSKRFQEFVRAVCRWAVTITTTAAAGFTIHARRWVVERTFGWLVRYRRLRVDDEYLPETSEAMTYATMIHRMLRRLHPSP